MRPNEAERKALFRRSSRATNGAEKSAAIKVGRDSGRVKVFVRVRPIKPQEISRKETVAVDVSELRSSIHVSDLKHSWEKDYPFDHVFPSDSTNHEVCSTLCRPIVNAALNGFNGTLMAYGQTGSGKTYTLMGPDGITSGVVDRCFKRIMQDTKHDYKVSMSYLQIYQEKIYDLLNSTNKVELNIREHPHKGVYVENLSEFVVRSPVEVMNLLAVGKKRLVFAETKMNRTSSRSHSVCMLLIERTLNKDGGKKSKDCVPIGDRKSPHHCKEHKPAGSPKKSLTAIASDCTSEMEEEEQDSLAKMTFTDDVLVRGRIHLCDLAGSERLKKTQAEGDRLSEAQHINSSLLELGNVIHALADGKQTHVPFRNSTLTRLLQESLGGNCKTSLIVCVSPTMADVSETKSTLNFGSRAMKVTNTAYVNVEVDYKKLSDDLTKMLDSREKDMEGLKESFENRMAKVKSEAEAMLKSSMDTAQEALAAVRSLFESKETNLHDNIYQLDEQLQKEKSLSSQLQQQMSSLSNCLHGGVYRAKSALLAELLSMQLFYAIRDMPEHERQELAQVLKDECIYSGNSMLETKEKVLENTTNTLELFQSYLKLLNISGEELTRNGLDLETLEEQLGSDGNGLKMVSLVNNSNELNGEEKDVASLEQNELLMTPFNQTDDDKTSDSQGTKEFKFLSLTKELRDKLQDIKGSLDSNAIEFLKKAFGMKGREGEKEERKEKVYDAMVEFLHRRENQQDTNHENPAIPMLHTEMAILDQSLCYVLVDKALQSAILLLEHTETRQECAKLLNNNNSLTKELEVMRLQVETLVSENTKLNSKLSETSNFLQDVKTSKTMLENDLSSVFQLYNMKSTEKPMGKSAASEKMDLQEGISSLVEENAKLKVELNDSKKQNEELESRLKNSKEQLKEMQKLVETLTKSDKTRASKAIQTLMMESKPAANGDASGYEETNGGEISIKTSKNAQTDTDEVTSNQENNTSTKKHTLKNLAEVEQFLMKLQGELIKLEDDESARFTQANQRQAVSSLRMNLNKRLGDLWSVEVVESKKLRQKVEELTEKLENTREDYERQLDELERELDNESQARLNLENELIQYRKEVMDLGAEIWSTNQNGPSTDVEYLSDSSRETSRESGFRSRSTSDVQDIVPPHQDEADGGKKQAKPRKLLRRVSSTHESDSDESLYEMRRSKDLIQAESDTKTAKAELQNLKQSFLLINQELADSGKIREELEERFVNLVSDNNVISLRLTATEEKNKELEHKLGHVSVLKTSLQDELLQAKSVIHIHLEDIRNYKEKIANFEVERTHLKQELSAREIKFTAMDNKYNEMEKELEDTKKLLQNAQGSLEAYEEELHQLRETCERLRNQSENDSERGEKLVEVKMKGGQRRDYATPSRIQSIHLVSRVKSQLNRKPSLVATKKKVTIKRSPRQEETLVRRNTLKKGAMGKKGTLTSPRDSKTLTRDSDRTTLKRTKTLERRPTMRRESDEDHKLKSELLLAKEQLVRLKGELTLSNIQTANLGTHLTSLREDSNKLEVELSSMRRAPNDANQDSNSARNGKNVEIELADAKEKIIELQDEMLSLRREKATSAEKFSESEEELKKLRADVYKSRDGLERSQEVVNILKKEIEVLTMKNQILQERLNNYSRETAGNVIRGNVHDLDQDISHDNEKESQQIGKEQLEYYEKDRLRLQQEIEELSNDKVKLEDMRNLVQKLVDVEDEQMALKCRLRSAVKDVEKDGSKEVSGEDSKNKHSSPKRYSRKMSEVSQNKDEEKFEEYYVENTALRCEVDALRIYIANLENEIKSMKYKLSVSESMQGNQDKKSLAVLLASAKHEREELRETLNSVYSEKEDLEEALSVAKVKTERLQRELSNVVKNKQEMEVELHAIKTGNVADDKDSPITSFSSEEERRLIELIKGFLYNIGVQNAEEKDILDLAKSLLPQNNQQLEKNPKRKDKENKHPWTQNSSSMARNLMRRGSSMNKSNSKSSSKSHASRHGAQANASNPKTHTPADTRKHNDSYSKLKRPKPGTDRGVPEGMETDKPAATKAINSFKQQDAGKDVGNDAGFMFVDNDVQIQQGVTEEVFIKRAWSLKDLFKRNPEAKIHLPDPSVVTQ